ncbi:protein CAJ1 [Corylus avellana]|uniref:protein CAJ1 n=1 Tax=Corylus avellana TaxID=13451 RepID=UPI00286C6CD1|nr:protein CAJ1 [Corylus avellana]
MQGDEARALLGFPPDSRPTFSQVKAAYRTKVWESHPDLFPAQEKPHAESKFKLISEAYSCLLSGNSLILRKTKEFNKVMVCKLPNGL